MYLTTEEKCKALQNSVSLRALFEEISRTTTGIPLGTHKYRLRTYTDCFLGSELVDWLICQQKANSRVQAAAISQALLEGGYIECVSDPCSFVDGYALYKPGSFVTPEISASHNYFETPNQEEPMWVQQVPHESSTTGISTNFLVHHVDRIICRFRQRADFFGEESGTTRFFLLLPAGLERGGQHRLPVAPPSVDLQHPICQFERRELLRRRNYHGEDVGTKRVCPRGRLAPRLFIARRKRRKTGS
jgi:hypothetical protein